ncbi:uncharacterized protein V1513DRAFT_446616 [Lipomyces chichibuensis]|uniref:uncharacterized protein n=1 Tax=Lipomyces chichibuensis TaxID=1546026 RepID=UPI00334393C9
MVVTTSPKHLWTTRKCHRVLRPLSSKLQFLRNLIGSYPSLLNNAGGHGNSLSGNGNIAGQTAAWEKNYRKHSGNIKTYSVKLSQSQSKSSSLPSRHEASVQESDKSSQYCADNLLLSLRDKTTPDVYAAYRSIFHAFHHFMLQTYESPATLAQKSAIELGKCVVYTLGTVSEDDWYDGMEVLKYYKRFIAIGHGVSLVARDVEFCRALLPALIVDCVEMEAFDMGLLLLRSFLEVTAIDDILVNYDMFCNLSKLVKSSPYILLQYIMTNLTVAQIVHSNLLEILNSLLANPIYNIEIILRNMLCHIFATGRREVRRSSHPQFKQVESAMLGISSVICRHPAVFDLSFITRVINTIGPAKARFTSVWQLLCIHQFYLGYINDEFVQYFHAPSTTPSASFRIRSRLRVALLDIYTDLEGQVRPIIERILRNVPKFAVALATLFVAKSRDKELLRWRGDVERCAMQLDRGLRTKNWVHDESLEEWVEVQENSSHVFSLISDDESEDELAGRVTDSLSDIEADELEATDDEQSTIGNISSQTKSCMISPAICEVHSQIPTSPVTVASQSGASRLLYMLPPPSSVIKLTPRSNRRIRDKYFRLLSTPATGGCTVDRPRPNWFTRSKSTTTPSDEEEFDYLDDSDEFENASPLQGRKRLGSSNLDDHPAKKSRACTTSNLAWELTGRDFPDFVEVADELSMTVSLDRKRLGDLTNHGLDAVKKSTTNTSSYGDQKKGSFKGRKVRSEQENHAEDDEDEDELFAFKSLSYTIDSSSRL